MGDTETGVDQNTAPPPRKRPGARVQITVCPRGPLLVRGDVELVDGDGGRIEERRPALALCRRGSSATKPLCDGSHKLTRFGRQPKSP